MDNLKQIAFGGGCHWCTEAVFQSLKGVAKVAQGYVSSLWPHEEFSEAVLLAYDPEVISLKELTLIHLITHESRTNHSRRSKYRSAVYTLDNQDTKYLKEVWDSLQAEFNEPLITKILPFKAFELSEQRFHNYYNSNPERPFCKRHIHPKLRELRKKFSGLLVSDATPDQ